MKINGPKLKSLRHGKGFSQQHLADAATVNKRTIQRAEAGGSVAFETLRAIAGTLEVNINEFCIFEEADDTESDTFQDRHTAALSTPLFEYQSPTAHVCKPGIMLTEIGCVESGLASSIFSLEYKFRKKFKRPEHLEDTTLVMWRDQYSFLTASRYGRVRMWRDDYNDGWRWHDDVHIAKLGPGHISNAPHAVKAEHTDQSFIVEYDHGQLINYDDITGQKLGEISHIYPLVWGVRPGERGVVAVQTAAGQLSFLHIAGGFVEQHGMSDQDTVNYPCTKSLTCHSSPIEHFAWHPAGRYFAVSAKDGAIAIWDYLRDEKIREIFYDDDKARRLSWSPNGQHLVVGDDVYLSGEDHPIAKLPERMDYLIWSDMQTPRLLVAGYDGTSIIDTQTWEILHTLDIKVRAATQVDWGVPSIVCNQGKLQLWDFEKGEKLYDLPAIKSLPTTYYPTDYAGVLSVAWRPGHNIIAGACSDGRTRLWKTVR